MLVPGSKHHSLLFILLFIEVASETCVFPDDHFFSECPAAEQYKKRGESAILYCARKSSVYHCLWTLLSASSDKLHSIVLNEGTNHNKYRKYRDGKTGDRSCNLQIIGVDDSDSGTWTCHPTAGGDVTVPTVSGKIIVPHKPQAPVIVTGEGSSMGNTVEVNEGSPEHVTCIARNGRPPAQVYWYIGCFNHTDPTFPCDKENVTQRAGGRQRIEDHEDNLYTSSRDLYWSKISELWRYNGRTLICRAEHMSYSRYTEFTSIRLKVMFPPRILSSIPVKYVPIAGSPTSITVHFASNPLPISSDINFHVTDGKVGDIVISPGLVTSNRIFNVSKLRGVRSPANDQYKVTLYIESVDEAVANSKFKVVIKNARGNVTKHFKIKIGDPPDPTPIIIAGVLGGILAVVLLAICIIVIITKRKQAKHRKHYRRRDERSDTESTGDPGDPNNMSVTDAKPRSGSLPHRPAPPPPITRVPSVHYQHTNNIKERDSYNCRMRDWETESRDWSPERHNEHKPDCLETAINCWFG